MGSKGVLMDSMGRCSVVCTGIIYALVFLSLCLVGLLGPEPILYASSPGANVETLCPDPANCVVSWTGALTDMTPSHQVMWLNAVVDRPVERVSGRPALASLPVAFDMAYEMDVVGSNDGEATQESIVRNTTHIARIFCAPGDLSCDSVTLFTAPLLHYSTYRLTTRFQNPSLAFASAPISSVVKIHFSMGYISATYTSFELGVKMFFSTSSFIIWAAFSFLLLCGPGARGEDGKCLSSSYEQRYVWWLGLFLVLFNEPLFPLAIENPTITLAGFNAFSVCTFLASLLTYWLVQFDLARIQGEGGLSFDVDPAKTKLGICFWLPKVVFASMFWTITLAAYMWQRMMQLSDPAYDLLNDTDPIIRQWFFTFIAVLIGLYLLYLFALLVLSCRFFRYTRPAARFVVAITVFTLIMCAVGILAKGFSPVRTESALFLAVYAAPNLYVWVLQFAFIPAPWAPQWMKDMLATGGDEGLGSEGGRGGGGGRGMEGEAIAADTSGVMGADFGEDTDVMPEDVELAIPVETRRSVPAKGRGAPGAAVARGGRRAAPAIPTAQVVRGPQRQRAPAPRAQQLPEEDDGQYYYNGEGEEEQHQNDGTFAIEDEDAEQVAGQVQAEGEGEEQYYEEEEEAVAQGKDEEEGEYVDEEAHQEVVEVAPAPVSPRRAAAAPPARGRGGGKPAGARPAAAPAPAPAPAPAVAVGGGQRGGRGRGRGGAARGGSR